MSSNANRIDVHFHIIPPFYGAAVFAAGPGYGPALGAYPAWTPELALEVMDANGIAVAITSLSQPGVHFGDPVRAATLARRCNDFAADLGARWPARFGAFATVPMPDVGGAMSEIEHALDRLRFDGVCLLASYGDRFLGDPELDPVLELLDRRRAVVFVHPNFHPSSRAIGMRWPGFMVEFVFDTTRAAVNLLFSGALERFPNIRFILAHAGGVLPYVAWRLSVAPMIDSRLPQLPRERILAGMRRFWYDTALSAGSQTMGTLTEVADPTRILFGSDWPFGNARVVAQSVKSLTECDVLSDQQRGAIDRGNALQLFPRFAA